MPHADCRAGRLLHLRSGRARLGRAESARLESPRPESPARESLRVESRSKKFPATRNEGFTESNLLGEKAA